MNFSPNNLSFNFKSNYLPRSIFSLCRLILSLCRLIPKTAYFLSYISSRYSSYPKICFNALYVSTVFISSISEFNCFSHNKMYLSFVFSLIELNVHWLCQTCENPSSANTCFTELSQAHLSRLLFNWSGLLAILQTYAYGKYLTLGKCMKSSVNDQNKTSQK